MYTPNTKFYAHSFTSPELLIQYIGSGVIRDPVYTADRHTDRNKTLAECKQCYCGKISQILTYHISAYCLKAYHRLDNSLRIVEYHRKNISKKIFTGTQIQDSFRFCILSSANLAAETIMFLFSFPIMLSYKLTNTNFTEARSRDTSELSLPLFKMLRVPHLVQIRLFVLEL